MDPVLALEQAVTAAPNTVARVRALNALSTELARTGQSKRAFTHADEARALAAKNGDRQLVAETGHALARCHFYLADFMRALEYLLDAAQMYDDAGDPAGAAAAFAGVGTCQHRLGANEDAVASMLRALESARAQKLSTLEINIHNSLGSALISANRLDEAAKYLRTGLELAQAANNRNLLTKLLHSSHCSRSSAATSSPSRATSRRSRSTRRGSRKARGHSSSHASSAIRTTRRTASDRRGRSCA
jgi:tetratricopeptide (TPR) repeat protein